MYCSVGNCRHKNTHNVQGHRCSKCKSFGHAADACSDTSIRRSYTVTPIHEEIKCGIMNCQHKDKHTTEGHYCRLCMKYGHGIDDCCKTLPEEYLKTKSGNVFYIEYGGMGCYIFYTRTYSGEIRELAIAGDNWGQYGSCQKVYQVLDTLTGFSALRTSDRDFLDRMRKCYSLR